MNERVPEGWELIPFKDVCFFQEGPGLRNWQYRDHGIKFINIRSIKDGDIDTSIAQHLSSDEVKEKYQHFLLNEGDYILSSSGTIGRLACVKKCHLPLLLNTSVIRFRSSNERKLDSLYLRHFLQSKQFFDKISEQSQGSAQVNFGPTHLNVLKVVLPSLPEQKKIESILTSVDEVIEKTQLQINKLQYLKKGAMNELLTKGIGHTEFKDSELGRIPKSWEVAKMSSVATVIDSLHETPTFSDFGVPMVRITDIKRGDLSFENTKKVSEENYRKFIKKYKPQLDDIVMSRVGSYGVSAYVTSDKPFCIGQNTVIINPVNISGRFLYESLESNCIQRQIELEVAGSGYKSLSLADIRALVIPIPPTYEQEQIKDLLLSIDRQVTIQKHKLAQTQSLKKSLMQDLLTGKVRVTVN